MAVELKHATVAVGVEEGNGEIGKAEWNADHALTGTADRLLGFDGAGSSAEVSLGAGLALSGNSLTAPGLDGKQNAENGFVDRTDSTISFVDGTRTFTIQPAVTDFTFFSGGTAFTKTGAENIVISDTEGEHFIYYDHSGTLQVVNSFSIDIIISYAFVALIYWDADNNTAITLADERHGNTMDSATHLYNHETFGTRYGGGLQVSDLDTDGTGDLDVHAQFSVSGGTIWDEDIEFTIPSVAVGVADIDFFYHDGVAGNWRRIAGNGFVTPDNGANRARYNNPDAGGAGVWGLTEVTNNDFLCMHLLATDCILSPFFLIIGQAAYTTLANARAGAGGELLSMDLGGLPSREYKAVATFVVQTSTGYSNTVASRIRTTDTGEHYIDWRSTQTGIAASVISAGLQNAAQVPFTPAGSIAATDVQAALEELDGDVAGFSGGLVFTVHTSAYTASANEGVLANTSGGVFTVTLPATPSAGDRVVVADATGDWATNNLTVGRNGSTIEGAAEDLVLDIGQAKVVFVFSGTTWRAYLQVGANGGATVTETDTQTLSNKTLTGPVVQSPEETYGAVTSTSGAVTLDLDADTVFSLALSENVTSMTISNPPAAGNAMTFILKVVQDSVDRSITWPASVDWAAATAPTLTSGSGKVDLFTFHSHDQGVTWYGFVSGQDMG